MPTIDDIFGRSRPGAPLIPRKTDPFASIGRPQQPSMDWLYDNIARAQSRSKMPGGFGAALSASSRPTGGGINSLWDIGQNVARAFIGENKPKIQSILAQMNEQPIDSEDLLQQALASLLEGGGGPNIGMFRRSVSEAYDPQIQALEDLMDTTRRRGSYNKRQLGSMYGALSRSLMGDIPEVREITRSSTKAAKSRYKVLERDVGSMYKDVADEEADLLQKLDIEAAAPDVFKEQFSDKAFTNRQTKEEAASVASALQQQGQGLENYTRSGAQIARQEGTNRQSDLMMQLQELLAQQGQGLAQLQGQKASELSRLIAGSQPDPGQRFSQLMDAARFKFELEQASQPEAAPPPGQGIMASADVLARQAPDFSQQGMGILYNTLMSPEAEGMEPEQIAALVRENTNLTPDQQLAVINAILAYYGKYQ